MRGTIGWQTQEIFKEVDQRGESKHEAKQEARDQGASTWAEVGAVIGVYSHSTADAYRANWESLGEYAKENFNVKDMTKLSTEHVNAFLTAKIEADVAHATFAQSAAAMAKLEQALNARAERLGTGDRYKFEMKEVRVAASKELARYEGSRAYQDPQAAVDRISNPDARLAASIMYEGGSRVAEATCIKASQLKGIGVDRETGQAVGSFVAAGKGGKVTTVLVSVETYRRLEAAVNASPGQTFRVGHNAVRDGLKDSTKKTGQDYQGSHGLRWSFAQERMAELQERGNTYESALLKVSREMGHERADITEHYLGK